eukprot:gene2177-4236_t
MNCDFQEIHKISRRVGGFVSNSNRAVLWPKLMGKNRHNTVNYRGYIYNHRDAYQIQCDVERSLWHFQHKKNWNDSFLQRRRKDLTEIMLAILCRNRDLYYYQGFHDFVSVFMIVLEDDCLAFTTAEAATTLFMTDFMCKDFESVSKLMSLILLIISTADPELYEFISQCSLEPFFATSWMLTWFSHDLRDMEHIARLFDAILCSAPCFILYLCSAVLICHKDEIMSRDCDFASVHTFISKLPRSMSSDGFSVSMSMSVTVEDIIHEADTLMLKVPPWELHRLLSPSSSDLRKLLDQGSIAMLRVFYGPKPKPSNNKSSTITTAASTSNRTRLHITRTTSTPTPITSSSSSVSSSEEQSKQQKQYDLMVMSSRRQRNSIVSFFSSFFRVDVDGLLRRALSLSPFISSLLLHVCSVFSADNKWILKNSLLFKRWISRL